MAYRWNPDGMTDPIVLPHTVSQQALTAATAEQWRVLVWLSLHRLQWDAAACAADCALTEAACEACLQYWLTQGALTLASDTAVPAPTRVARPAAVKPQLREVLAYQKAHPRFADFLQEVSALLGKPIGHADTATILYLLDTVGLPENVLYTEVGYAVSIGKPNMRYIEKIALDWADKDLTTIQAVEEHIRELENERRAAERVEKILSLTHPLTAAQAKTADKWLNLWCFKEEMLQRAAEITVEKTGKFQVPYTDRILERWHAEGVDTLDKIPAVTPAKKRGVAATNPEHSSLDTASLDAQLLRFTPKI